MTKLDRRMIKGNKTLYLSSIVDTDIDTRAKMTALNAAIAKSEFGDIVFDRAYNITFTRDANTGLFLIPASGRNFYGVEGRPITLNASTAITADGYQKHIFSASGTEGTPVALTADLAASMDQVFCTTTGMTVGQKIRISSDKTFLEGGTKISFASAVSGLYDDVDVGDTITQGGASARVCSRYPEAGGNALYAGFVLDTVVGTFTTSADVFNGGDNLGTPTGVYNGVTEATEKQGEIVEIYEVNVGNVRFFPPSHDAYAMANNATVTPLAMIGPTKIEGVQAVGVGQLDDLAAAAIAGDRFVSISLADRLRLIDTTAKGFDGGSFIYSCIDGLARGNRWTTDITSDAATRDVIGYGLGLANACQNWLIEHNSVAGFKHGFVQTESATFAGVTRDIMFQHNHVAHTWNFAFAAHTNGSGLNVFHNIIDNSSGGIEAGCKTFRSGFNKIRCLQFIAAEIGSGIAITEVCQDVRSTNDETYGGGWGLRCQDTVTPGVISANEGPSKIHIDNFYSESANQVAVRIWWGGIGDRDDIQINNLQTRNVGQPVDGDGNPTTGAALAAPSLDIRGSANGQMTGVKIFGGDLRGWTGGTQAAIVGQYVDGHCLGVSYDNHTAPSFDGTCNVISANLNEH